MPAGATRLVPPSSLPRGPSTTRQQQQEVYTSSGLTLGPSNMLSEGQQSQEECSRSDNSGEDQDNEPPRKKRYHRHTPRQIQELEAFFQMHQHPDDKQRQELSRQLGLEPRQVKFWFQNRRTQLKTQQERIENSSLRVQMDKLKAENITMRETIKNAICAQCGGPALGEMSFDAHQLHLENARLKDELDRVSALAAKYLGTQHSGQHSEQHSGLNSELVAPSSSLDLAVGGNGHQAQGSSIVSAHPEKPGSLTGCEKHVVVELAVTAMEELVRLCETNECWIPNPNGPKDDLDYDFYIRQFTSALGPRPPGMKTEATRATDVVLMNSISLLEIFLDAPKWVDIFPCMISRAGTLETLSAGSSHSRNGALQVMYAELQVLSPLVPTREIYFLRYCKQHADGIWAVVDVSLDGLRDPPESEARVRVRPSGYIIQDMPNGCSKVTVLQHMEYDDAMVNSLYLPLVNSGLAFGAQRWLSILHRQCERFASLLSTRMLPELGVIPNVEARRIMLRLAQRMTSQFCGGISASTVHTWTTLSGNTNDDDVRVMTRKSIDNPGEPHGIVLSATTSFWLPVTPKRVFEFLRDERLRNEWDILSNGGVVHQIAHIAKGEDPGNSVCLLRVDTCNTGHNNMLILQESCIDAAGALIVYAPVDIPAITLVMQGSDPAYVALLPSGFAILPDGREFSSILERHGSLLTVAFQILVSSTPTGKLSLESVGTVNNLITCTVQRIKAALQRGNS